MTASGRHRDRRLPVPVATLLLLCSAVFVAYAHPQHVFQSDSCSSLHVATNGTDSPDCGQVGTPCSTLRFAVENRTFGCQDAVVYVAAGMYKADSCDVNVFELQSLSVVGQGAADTVVDCGGVSTALQWSTTSVGPNPQFVLADITIKNGFSSVATGAVVYGGCLSLSWSDADNQPVSSATSSLPWSVTLSNVNFESCIMNVSEWAYGMGAAVGVVLQSQASVAPPAIIQVLASNFSHSTVMGTSVNTGEASGGALALRMSAVNGSRVGDVMTVARTRFNNNTATILTGNQPYDNVGTLGGAAFLFIKATQAVRDSVINISESQFINSSADTFSAGGGLCTYVTADGDSGSANNSFLATNSLFQGNAAGNGFGGGLYYEGSLACDASDAFFLPTQVTIHKCNFTDSIAGTYGGGAFVAFHKGTGKTTMTDCLFEGNAAGYMGGGMFFESDSDSNHSTSALVIERTAIQFCSARDIGGGGIGMILHDEWYNSSGVYTSPVHTVLIKDSDISDCDTTGDGGGMLLLAYNDEGAYPAATADNNEFLQYEYASVITLDHSTVSFNNANGRGSSGGGIAASNVRLLVSATNVTSCAATIDGGGILLKTDITALEFNGSSPSRMEGSTSQRGDGAQICAYSSGTIDISGLHMNLGSEQTQLYIQHGGAFLTSTQTLLQCPPGSIMVDRGGGSYGANAIPVPLISNNDWMNFQSTYYLISRAQFVCVPCASGMYTVRGGFSNGTAAYFDNPTCTQCPLGGECLGTQQVTSAGGYWGNTVGNSYIEFVQCPQGYCCTKNCTSAQACIGNRYGNLCGTCKPGYGEVIGSTECTHASTCTDMKWVWPVIVVLAIVGGAVLLVLAEAFADPVDAAKGTIKVSFYFFQMVPLVTLSSQSRASYSYILSTFQTMFGWQPPESSAGKFHVCLWPHMSTTAKLQLGYITPVMLGAGMLIVAVCYVLYLRWKRRGATDVLPLKDHDVHQAFPAKSHDKDRLKACIMYWGLNASSSLLDTSTKLLSFTTLPGIAGSMMYYNANNSVFSPDSFIPALITLAAVLLFTVYVWKVSTTCAQPTVRRPGVYRLLCEPYKKKYRWWEVALIVQRCLITALSACLLAFPLARAVSCAIVAAFSVVLQAWLKPFRDADTQRLQNCLQFCFLLVCLLNIPYSTQIQLAVPSRNMNDVVAGTEWFLFVVGLLCMLLVPVVAVFITVKKHHGDAAVKAVKCIVNCCWRCRCAGPTVVKGHSGASSALYTGNNPRTTLLSRQTGSQEYYTSTGSS